MDRKFGEGHVAAMGRLGLKELRNALNPSRESVADQEIGLYGTQTQGEIAKARSGPGEGLEQAIASSGFSASVPPAKGARRIIRCPFSARRSAVVAWRSPLVSKQTMDPR